MFLAQIPLYLCSYLDLIVNIEIITEATEASESRDDSARRTHYPSPYPGICAILLTINEKPLRLEKR